MAGMHDAVTSLPGIADKMARTLKKLTIETVFDLISHLPVDYEDRRTVCDVARVKPDQHVTIRVRIELLQSKRSHRRRMHMCEALCADSTGSIRVVWFGNQFVIKTLKVGDEVFLYGKVYEDTYGVQLRSPEYEKVKEHAVHATRIVPRYRLTRGLTHKHMRHVMSKALDACVIEEWIPEIVRSRNSLIDAREAYQAIHFPRDWKHVRMAQKRLKFDELFSLQLRSLLTREELSKQRSYAIDVDEKQMRGFVKRLPFSLTDGQKKAVWQVLCDMRRPYPMNRLLQGDVGSGKTVVSVMALYHVALSGHVGMLMVPTEILAQQHFDTISRLLTPLGVRVGLYTRTSRRIAGDDGVLTKAQFARRACEVQVLVGTHALLFDDMPIERLALVVVDEQHRFGVRQRQAIKDRTQSDCVPHFLSMTATPIPRSAALVLYGELDISVIREKPAGRKSIITKLVSDRGRTQAYAFIRNQLDRERQVFVVCPLIEESDVLDVASVDRVFERLSQVFSDYRVEMLHGKMTSKQKDEIMTRMVAGDIDVLVSTSVIEVGVDVANASVMMIEGAERFGLAQLHQFRGRIGRAEHQSYCFVFPTHTESEAITRLRMFEGESDGFRLAQYDLRVRGPGDMYGTVQSGFPDLTIATLKDVEVIEIAQREARGLFDVDPTRDRYPDVWRHMSQLMTSVHLE